MTGNYTADCTYSSGEVSRLTGVSLRQLQWWDEHDLITPQQEAHRRQYTREQVCLVNAITQFKAKGLSLQKIRSIIKAHGHKFEVTEPDDSTVGIYCDGKFSVFGCSRYFEAIDWLVSQNCTAIVIDLEWDLKLSVKRIQQPPERHYVTAPSRMAQILAGRNPEAHSGL